MSRYERSFEGARDRAIIISDLIEQIILVDKVIQNHLKAGTTGMQIEQYRERKLEFSQELNDQLAIANMMIIERQAA